MSAIFDESIASPAILLPVTAEALILAAITESVASLAAVIFASVTFTVVTELVFKLEEPILSVGNELFVWVNIAK